MGKYIWSKNKNEEIWLNSSFDTIKECIDDAIQNDVKAGEIIYIGETEEYTPFISGDEIIDTLQERAYEECGEASEGWLQNVSNEQTDELADKVLEIINEWLEKVNEKPNFSKINNIKEYKIK